MKKKLLILVLIIVIISSILIYTSRLWKPIPEDKRNISTSNVQMLVDMDDNRTPIIRTYTKKEYNEFTEKQINKIKETVNGNIEGDIPQLTIYNGEGTLKFSFVKTEKNDTSTVTSNIMPDNTPKIKMLLLQTIYSKEEPKEVQDLLIKSMEEDMYLYKVRKYNNEDESYLQSMFIEINYEINKEKYISIFAINTTESKE